jgi:hypothetical protein
MRRARGGRADDVVATSRAVPGGGAKLKVTGRANPSVWKRGGIGLIFGLIVSFLR